MKDGDTCQSILCGNRLEPLPNGTWRRTPRLFCSDTCRQVASIIRRAGKLLATVPDDRVLEILRDRG